MSHHLGPANIFATSQLSCAIFRSMKEALETTVVLEIRRGYATNVDSSEGQ